ncbi:hypothetical protein NFC81_15680 [Salinispirillum sp. LH 10-3-1]|uniref:Alpha/beta hydrolase n=1 Tax=Salinispirillum sp. LH 10-3-1 TaxID=2952525 RepID=A0AB38YFR2_9GAMM
MPFALWLALLLVVLASGCARQGVVEHYQLNDDLISLQPITRQQWHWIDWSAGEVDRVRRHRDQWLLAEDAYLERGPEQVVMSRLNQPAIVAERLYVKPELWRLETVGSFDVYWAPRPGPLVVWLGGFGVDDTSWLPAWLNHHGVSVVDLRGLMANMPTDVRSAAVQLNRWFDAFSRLRPEHTSALGLLAGEQRGSIALEASAREPRWQFLSVAYTPMMSARDAEMLRAEVDGFDIELWEPFWLRCLDFPNTDCRRPPQGIQRSSEVVRAIPYSLTGAWATYDFSYRPEPFELDWINWAQRRDWTYEPQQTARFVATPQFWLLPQDTTQMITEERLAELRARGVAIEWATMPYLNDDLRHLPLWQPGMQTWANWWRAQVRLNARPWD